MKICRVIIIVETHVQGMCIVVPFVFGMVSPLSELLQLFVWYNGTETEAKQKKKTVTVMMILIKNS